VAQKWDSREAEVWGSSPSAFSIFISSIQSFSLLDVPTATPNPSPNTTLVAQLLTAPSASDRITLLCQGQRNCWLQGGDSSVSYSGALPIDHLVRPEPSSQPSQPSRQSSSWWRSNHCGSEKMCRTLRVSMSLSPACSTSHVDSTYPTHIEQLSLDSCNWGDPARWHRQV